MMAELRSLMADIHELGRSLDGSLAAGQERDHGNASAGAKLTTRVLAMTRHGARVLLHVLRIAQHS